MKQYPTMSGKILRNIDIYAFDKLDGSNIRAEWSRKRGFYKFGSRKRLLGSDQESIVDAQDIIIEKYERDLTKIFKEQGWERVICFFEFYGDNSFAGQHENELHDVILLDVNPYKKGIMLPQDFIHTFSWVHTPKLLYYGKANVDFESEVRKGLLHGMTFEGVVCKGPLDKKKKMVTMFKIKSHAWLNKLREHCGENDKLFEVMK